MRKTSILVGVVVAGTVLMLLVGSAAAQNATINAEAQSTEGDNVTIDSVEIDEDGWVAVYEESIEEGPNFDALVGSAEVSEGTNFNIEVETDIEEDMFYYAVLHYDESVSTGFNYPQDPVVESDGSQVQDFFFVSVGTREIHQQYANAKQDKRETENRIDDLRDQIEELERRGGDREEFQSDIDSLRDQIDRLEQDVAESEETISEAEELLARLEDVEERRENMEERRENMTEDGDGMSDDSGTVSDDEEMSDDEEDGATDGGSGDEDTDTGSESDGGTEDEPAGLPGFTAVAALVALLTGGALLRRGRE